MCVYVYIYPITSYGENVVNMGERERTVSVGREDQVRHLRIEKSKRWSQEMNILDRAKQFAD